jgi:NHL repeat
MSATVSRCARLRTPARERAHTNASVPDRRRLYADMAVLLWQDLANVEGGLYPLPADHDGSLLTLIHRSQLFFEDMPERTVGKRPRYYLQNFHFQSGGWMTEESAGRYDTQVEVLFNGTANATRRQALPQLHEVFAGCDQCKLRLLDIGCGTGRFLDLVKQVWPRFPSLGLDLSEPWGHEGPAPGDFDDPHDIAIGGSMGSVYVADRRHCLASIWSAKLGLRRPG